MKLTILSACGRKLTVCVGIECPSLTTCPIYRYAVLSSKRFSVGDQLLPEVSALHRSLDHPAASVERELTEGDEGVPHQLTKDDVYNGFFFKKGTNFHANQW